MPQNPKNHPVNLHERRSTTVQSVVEPPHATPLTRKGYYVAEEDLTAIAIIRQRYGLSTDSDAVRLALRLVADPEAIKVSINQKKVKSAGGRLRSA